MIFIDANIFCSIVRDESRRSERCTNFIKRIEAGEVKAMITPLVLDEVVWVAKNEANDETALLMLKKICEISNLEIKAIDKETVALLPEMLSTGLEPRDAFHAAAMKQYNSKAILSYDKKFDKIRWLKRIEPK